MEQTYNLPRKKAFLWLGVFALVGIVLVLLYPDGYQQDSGYHFLFARWGWRHPYMFVGVWSRPLFTFLFGFPALLGFEAARLFSLAIGLATAWQTWKLARDLKLERSWLSIVLIFLQPSFFILYPDLLTEPLYALIFVIALRLHLRGRVKTGMLVASLMVLTRPEGFFHGILWGIWVLFDKRVSPTFWRRLPPSLLLASGGILWWAAAFIVTKDPLFIKNNWPSQWQSGVYGDEPFYAYFLRLPEMVGLVLVVPFLYGLVLLLKRRELGTVTSSFLLLFLLHATFRTLGILGDAGYPRYMVCVAPVMAIITLVGWNEVAQKFAHLSSAIKLATASLILGISAGACVLYMDGLVWIRDAWAIKEAHQWFQQNPRPVKKLVWSHAYMCIRFDSDPTENVIFTPNRDDNLKQLQSLPSGTLVFWDGQVGPSWNNLNDKDFESLGYKRLFSRTYELRGLIWPYVPQWLVMKWPFVLFKDYAGIRPQEMHLFYRE